MVLRRLNHSPSSPNPQIGTHSCASDWMAGQQQQQPESVRLAGAWLQHRFQARSEEARCHQAQKNKSCCPKRDVSVWCLVQEAICLLAD